MSDEIKLTLDPFGTDAVPSAEAIAEAATQAVEEATGTVEAPVAVASDAEEKVKADAMAAAAFTPEEQAMIDAFSQQIDITDTNLVFSYGAAAQQNISQFADSTLKNVQTKDLDEVGDMISQLVVELRGFDVDEREGGGILGFFKKKGCKKTRVHCA